MCVCVRVCACVTRPLPSTIHPLPFTLHPTPSAIHLHADTRPVSGRKGLYSSALCMCAQGAALSRVLAPPRRLSCASRKRCSPKLSVCISLFLFFLSHTHSPPHARTLERSLSRALSHFLSLSSPLSVTLCPGAHGIRKYGARQRLRRSRDTLADQDTQKRTHARTYTHTHTHSLSLTHTHIEAIT